MDIDLTKQPLVAKANAAPGPGGDYDWAFHPKDGRLYAVDGDNGSLMYFAPPEYKMAVLKEKAFPKADGPSGTGISRPVYGAVFFSETGVLFAIDSAGNAYKVDLTKSEASKPIEAKDVPDYQSVGGGKIPLADKIRVIDAAGGYKDKISIVYDWLTITSQPRSAWQEDKGFRYSWHLSLTAKNPETHEEEDVRTYRIMFDLPESGVMKEWSDLILESHEAGKIYLKTAKDHFIAKGTTIAIDIQFYVEGPKLEYKELPGLRAVRLT